MIFKVDQKKQFSMHQRSADGSVLVKSISNMQTESILDIAANDMVELIHYYRYCKINDMPILFGGGA